MMPAHREFSEYVDYAHLLGLHDVAMDCAAGEHDLFFVDHSFDHEYGTEVVYLLECKHCPHQEPYDGRFDFDDEGGGSWWWLDDEGLDE